MSKYVLSLDVGTTSCVCTAYDPSGKEAAECRREIRQIFPQPGWVEEDPTEIFNDAVFAMSSVINRVGAKNIVSIGITNQRETVVLWDRNTAEPVFNAIVWQCRRTSRICDGLKADGMGNAIRSKTGLPIDAYFSASKVQWILENIPGVREKAESGDVLFGNIDTWIIWNLTRGNRHVTDPSNASRTMLFDIHKMEWDSDLLALFGVPGQMMPEVLDSDAMFGEVRASFFGEIIPITGVLGDQQAAMYGQGCVDPGDVKCTYGTGAFMLMNTGSEPAIPYHGSITTVAWKIGGKTSYALEGSAYSAGSAVEWLKDIGLIDSLEESSEIAENAGDTGGCYFVPAFSGLASLYWSQDARATAVGITRATGRGQIVRAVLESIAFEVNDLLESMAADHGSYPTVMKVDGGVSKNDFLVQFQADLSGLEVERSASVEATSFGAALLAGRSYGFWELEGSDREIFPTRTIKAEREEMIHGWHRAIRCALEWAHNGHSR
jgi:glycerol kinase